MISTRWGLGDAGARSKKSIPTGKRRLKDSVEVLLCLGVLSGDGDQFGRRHILPILKDRAWLGISV